MKRIVVSIPGLLAADDQHSVLRQKLPNLERIAEGGLLFKVAPIPDVETPEAFLLGLKPSEGQLRQGPLTVSALGADPPDRSLHFHLSLGSLCDGNISVPDSEPSPDEVRLITGLAAKLNTKLLTVVPGEILDHGLVWEALGDLGTTSLRETIGFRDSLPEGDGEPLLRRLIDDSVNLLSEQDFNLRRIDEGLPPFNILWPWGHGQRHRVPNLFLQRGERATVESGSLRLAGLTRLTQYVHGDRAKFGRGTKTKFKKIAQRAADLTIISFDAAYQFRSREQTEELDWVVRELDREFLGPLLMDARESMLKLTLVTNGLGLNYLARHELNSSIPFDERALDERSLKTIDLWSAIEQGLAP